MHPGQGIGQRNVEASLGEPLWWRALTDYSERLETRGGPALDLCDPRIFYDTSSYGPVAIETMAQRVGPDQLIYGSDRPVIEPATTSRDALLQANGANLLARIGAAA